MPALEATAKAASTSARRCPFASGASTRSESDSTAVVTKSAPSRPSSATGPGWPTRCSTFAVKSKVRSGQRSLTARATRSAWPGPFTEVGVSERDVARASRDLARDVRDDRLDRD